MTQPKSCPHYIAKIEERWWGPVAMLRQKLLRESAVYAAVASVQLSAGGEVMEARELIDIICPKHWRTSCSDTDVSNGFHSHDVHGNYRCLRCALLEVASGHDVPECVKAYWADVDGSGGLS